MWPVRERRKHAVETVPEVASEIYASTFRKALKSIRASVRARSRRLCEVGQCVRYAAVRGDFTGRSKSHEMFSFN